MTFDNVLTAYIAAVAALGKHTVEELTEIYHSTPEYKNAHKKCPVILTKGPRDKLPCDRKCAKDSDTCSKHKPKEEINGDVKLCIYEITKGPREGQQCGKKVAKKCPYGVACSAHKSHAAVLAGEEDAPEKKKKARKSSTEKKDTVKCCHLLTTGTREGDVCGVSVTEKSSSKTLCTRHANMLSKGKKKSGKKKIDEISINRIKGVKGPDGGKIYLEETTQLVFNKDKAVIGHWENKEIVELTLEDLQAAKEKKFTIAEGVVIPTEETEDATVEAETVAEDLEAEKEADDSSDDDEDLEAEKEADDSSDDDEDLEA